MNPTVNKRVRSRLDGLLAVAAILGGLGQGVGLAGQEPAPVLDRVLAFPKAVGEERLPPDRGSVGVLHLLRKLATTGSLLYVTSHPDDENPGVLTLASREWGARTGLFSLTRGEGGANAIGPELFDGLGLIRTRELVLSGRHYALDDLYFANAVDYGYSKSADEAFRIWNRADLVEDLVRVIRLNRPLVLVSHWGGTYQDGHGHHQATGILISDAVRLAADPEAFPEQVQTEGLRPWRPLIVYRGRPPGGTRRVEVDTRHFSPLLGTTYSDWGRRALALQRSQTAGRIRGERGPSFYYEVDRVAAGRVSATEPWSDATFFAGIDTRLAGLSAVLREEATPELDLLLARLQGIVDTAIEQFDFLAPWRAIPSLTEGLRMLREEILPSVDTPEILFHLRIKERQFQDAIVAAAGIEVEASLADPARGAVVIPGDTASVSVTVSRAVSVRSETSILLRGVSLVDRSRTVLATMGMDGSSLDWTGTLDIAIPPDADGFEPYFSRTNPAESRYEVSDSVDLHLPWRRPPLTLRVDLAVGGVDVREERPVTGLEPRLPYGSVARVVQVLPRLSVTMDPAVRVVPSGEKGTGREATPIRVRVRVEATAAPLATSTMLEVPDGWSVEPSQVENTFGSPGEVIEVPFSVRPAVGWRGEAVLRAVSHVGEQRYDRGYSTIEYRDLRLARLWADAETVARSVDTPSLSGRRVGYIMGVGDQVPQAIEALGATVDLLDAAALSELSGPEGRHRYDVIVAGTRAYAVRPDLLEHNQAILEFARRGGHYVVLYQTQEFVPEQMAPFHASLPPGAEEVTDEGSPVVLLAPEHPMVTVPNRLFEGDFDGWVEQRGSKFFSEWAEEYTPLVETQDLGQVPQRGIWLTAPLGEGRYTYLALALHRQLPYGVPGAVRILVNALAAGGSGG